MWVIGEVEVRLEQPDLIAFAAGTASLQELQDWLNQALKHNRGPAWVCWLERAAFRDTLILTVAQYANTLGGKAHYCKQEITAALWYNAGHDRRELLMVAVKACLRSIDRLRETEVPDGASEGSPDHGREDRRDEGTEISPTRGNGPAGIDGGGRSRRLWDR